MQKSLGYTRCLVAGLTVALLLALGACGFHLRGDVQLAPQLARVQIQGGDVYDPLVRDLTRALTAAGSTVVAEATQATAILQILRNGGNRRVLSVQTTGKVQEYELHQIFEFRVRDAAGRELLEPQRLELTRDYLFDANDVLGKSGEEEVLRRDMRRDLVRLTMLRLEALAH